MTDDEKKAVETMTTVLRNLIIPGAGIIAWFGMMYAYVVEDKTIDLIWMTSSLAVAGIGSAAGAFKVVRELASSNSKE